QAIENLRNAGAKIIGIDVDFSSRGTPGEDAKLARAIEAGAGDVILPVFVQPERQSGGATELVEVQPDEALRKGALFASVNLIADPDGQLRKSHLGFSSDKGFRPSMAAVLAGEAAPMGDAFLIDFAIDEEKITRLSFIDVLAGTFDKSLVDGR